jgi:excisionase family DNA binding protein
MQMKTSLNNIFEKIDFIVNSIEKIESKLKVKEIIKPPPKKLSINQTIIFLSERGVNISKSYIYKLTSSKSISFQRFGNRLVFSEDELEMWITDQLKEKNESNVESVMRISNSARNKINKNYGTNKSK